MKKEKVGLILLVILIFSSIFSGFYLLSFGLGGLLLSALIVWLLEK